MPRIVFAAIGLLAWMAAAADATERLRVGYFPNLTHAVPIVGLRQGQFARVIGDQAVIEPRTFNAGPAAMEALLAGELDLVYIGPGPAITGFVRSKGRALRVVAGAASGGASLVVRANLGIGEAKDLAGRRLASPQIGNTQDVALRIFLREHGLVTRERGGTVSVLPVANPDIITLFRKGELDGAWVPEPWAALLRRESGARELVDERSLWPRGEFPTTVLVATNEFLAEHPALVERWLFGQIEVSSWINANPSAAKAEVNAGLRDLTTRDIPPDVLEDAWSRLGFGEEILSDTFPKLARDAQALGYLPASDVSALVEPKPLERARAAQRSTSSFRTEARSASSFLISARRRSRSCLPSPRFWANSKSRLARMIARVISPSRALASCGVTVEDEGGRTSARVAGASLAGASTAGGFAAAAGPSAPRSRMLTTRARSISRSPEGLWATILSPSIR